MPRHTNEQRPVVAKVGRPPLLRIRHQGMQILDHGIQVESLELFRVIELLAHRIGQRGMLVQDLQVHLIRPPINIRVGFANAVSYRALRFGYGVFFLGFGDNAPRRTCECVFHNVFILRIMTRYYVKKLFFGAAAATEAKDLDQRLRQIKAVRQLPG